MKTIFVVDDSITNLQAAKSAMAGVYNAITIPSAEKMFGMLDNITPDLILLDVDMPVVSGYDAIKRLKGDKKARSIPVIFLTAKNDVESEIKGFSLGAADYITKPFPKEHLLKRLEVHLLVSEQRKELENYNLNLEKMVEEKTRDVDTLQDALIATIAELVECRDDITGGHIERTREYLRILLEALRERGIYSDSISKWDWKILLNSAQLHDVGKIGIPDDILKKTSRLTEEEYDVMKTHSEYGVKIIEKIEKTTPTDNEFLEYAKIFAGAHHEKWDGSGYPSGLKGTAIPLQGRLMAIVDVYDALISVRPYKGALSHIDAINIIAKGRGSHFDPAIVDVFLSVGDRFEEAAKRYNCAAWTN